MSKPNIWQADRQDSREKAAAVYDVIEKVVPAR